MLISLAYATARPQLVPEVIKQWVEKALPSPPFEVIVCTDAPLDDEIDRKVYRTHYAVSTVMNTGPRCCVSAWNEAARYCTGDIIFQIADDLYPIQDWNVLISKELNTERAEVLAIADDHLNRPICRHAIMTRKYYEKAGYLLYPAYESMYSDDDFQATAKKHADRFVNAINRIHFTHQYKGTEFDEISKRHESRERYAKGAAIFRRRQAEGFPLK